MKHFEILNQIVAQIRGERIRQLTEEGYTLEHDDEQDCGELADAAGAYALHAAEHITCGDDAPPIAEGVGLRTWPWDVGKFKPGTPRENLIKAAALIIAEIERLDRSEARRAAHADHRS